MQVVLYLGKIFVLTQNFTDQSKRGCLHLIQTTKGRHIKVVVKRK